MSQMLKHGTIPDFFTLFEGLEDPRQQAKIVYPLDDVLLLVLCAVICGYIRRTRMDDHRPVWRKEA